MLTEDRLVRRDKIFSPDVFIMTKKIIVPSTVEDKNITITGFFQENLL